MCNDDYRKGREPWRHEKSSPHQNDGDCENLSYRRYSVLADFKSVLAKFV